MSFVKQAGLLVVGAAVGFGLSFAVAPTRAQGTAVPTVDDKRLVTMAVVKLDGNRAVFVQDMRTTGCYLMVTQGSASAITQAPNIACTAR
jgi:hypothetical protein